MVVLQSLPKGHKVPLIVGKVRQFIVGHALFFEPAIEMLIIVFQGIDQESNRFGGKDP